MRIKGRNVKASDPGGHLVIIAICAGAGCNESKRYSRARKRLPRALRAWHVEAMPDVCQQLCENLNKLPGQTPLVKCLFARSGVTISFQVATNGGESSSLLPLGRHRHCCPMIVHTHSIQVVTSTVDELIREGEVDADFDLLVIDAQGAELMILEESRQLLASRAVRYAFIETSVEPLYEGGSSYLEVARFLWDFGLDLRELIFHDNGWRDVILEWLYWPTSLPCSDVAGGDYVAPVALLEFSTSNILAPPCCFFGERPGPFHSILRWRMGPGSRWCSRSP